MDSIQDVGFQALIQTLALGTTAQFSYKPEMTDLKNYLAKKRGVKATSLEHTKLSDAETNEATSELIAIQNNLPLSERACVGDASETGLIKFCESLLPLK